MQRHISNACIFIFPANRHKFEIWGDHSEYPQEYYTIRVFRNLFVKVLVFNVIAKLFDIASLSREPKNYAASSSLCSIIEQGYKYT
jgi:hypothetical protein